MMFTVESGVAGTLKKHDKKEEDRRDKVKDKSDRATTEQVLDDRYCCLLGFLLLVFFQQDAAGHLQADEGPFLWGNQWMHQHWQGGKCVLL